MVAESLIKPILLNNGHVMPRLGVGTFMLLGDKCQEVVTKAIELGYRHIDTAYSYKNEADIGTTVHQCEQKGLLKRKAVFITTKIPPVYLAPSDVKLCVEESLENLKFKYIDLVLIHNPWTLKNRGDGDLKPLGPDGYHLDYAEQDLRSTWCAMEDMVKAGKVRSIGLSNCKASVITDIVQASTLKPQNVQFECHLYYQQNKLKSLCDKLGITGSAYSPLGAPGRPANQNNEQNKNVMLLDDTTVASMATKYNKTSAQVLLRFLLQQGFACLPKASSDKRLIENMDIFDFEISDGDMETLKGLDRGLRYFTFQQYYKHPAFPAKGEPF